MKLSAKETQEKLKDGSCYLDVRSMDEFQSGHVPGARCVPLDSLDEGVKDIPRDNLIILGCQAGSRSQQAFDQLSELGFKNIAQLEGGYEAWKKAGLGVNKARPSGIPVMRQVQIVAGLLVFIGSALGLFVHPGFLGIPLFVGAGLTFAGASGWCGMAKLLEFLPWNRTRA